ncbi:hypothetical protein [Allosalinactinospora lopnorensis]|nr:hypothetical protein [Allosalinactinospora lopnorensis]
MAAGPMWGTWQPPVALELGVVLLLAAVALTAAPRRFGRPS